MYQYTVKWKYNLKMIQIITTFDEIFKHTLNMSWLYHFNSIWKIPFIWFHKKHLDEVFSFKQSYLCSKKKFVEKLLSFERQQ
jgi:hypothetical protein